MTHEDGERFLRGNERWRFREWDDLHVASVRVDEHCTKRLGTGERVVEERLVVPELTHAVFDHEIAVTNFHVEKWADVWSFFLQLLAADLFFGAGEEKAGQVIDDAI